VIALDTSVALPQLVKTHDDHAMVSAWWNHVALATRDARARTTYEAVGVRVIAVATP
jgi:hypothetical protein